MYPENAIPLIVCGRQRAGTRFVTDALNQFDEVALQGEIPTQVMKAIRRFIKEADSYYAGMARSASERRQREGERWQDKRRDILFSIWENAGQSGVVPYGPGTRYFGYKRPGHEDYFAFYEKALTRQPPRYVYCLRSFEENYLSIASRWPHKTIEAVSEDYMKSIATYGRMAAAAPDRVLLFNLDDYVVSGPAYLDQQILRPLGLEPDAALRRTLEEMPPKNRTEQDNNAPRRRELTDEERAFLAQRPDIGEAFARLSVVAA